MTLSNVIILVKHFILMSQPQPEATQPSPIYILDNPFSPTNPIISGLSRRAKYGECVYTMYIHVRHKKKTIVDLLM